MNPAVTIKLFLPHGDPKKVRTAEISNWSGKAVAAPRTDLDHLLARPEMSKPGVYMLLGVDEATGGPLAYVGEAEVVGDRLKQHKGKEFWHSAIVFVSKDENLTKSHIRHLEGRIISTAQKIGRCTVTNAMASGAHLPESDTHDMDVYFERIVQLLPVLGSDMLTPVAPKPAETAPGEIFMVARKGAAAKGVRSPNGFVIFSGSTAALNERPSAQVHAGWILALRDELLKKGALFPENGYLKFTKDVEFASPSAAAGVVFGGNAAGPAVWKNASGMTLKEFEGDGAS
jgi:hypothetical protein